MVGGGGREIDFFGGNRTLPCMNRMHMKVKKKELRSGLEPQNHQNKINYLENPTSIFRNT